MCTKRKGDKLQYTYRLDSRVYELSDAEAKTKTWVEGVDVSNWW
jgi:hypothetical protein